ncbi:fic/DOC family protein [Microdochium bolleyi]|uniref:Fic/DOC family protein n=1 Tax=Microdochium bolleyi TaxID=196109 RepID=A0A136IR42_9PEZI|nr:fic/DOC family protein [Microdochium bolleyi]
MSCRIALTHHRQFLAPCARRQASTTPAALRLAKLKEVYAPFRAFRADSEEYNALAKSGTVWENYFRPQETAPYDELQRQHKDTLAEIDEWREVMKLQIPDLGKTLVAEYAHQSVSIEDNPIDAGESRIIFDLVDKEILGPANLAGFSAHDLHSLSLPQYHSPTDPSAVRELMNHIIASQWIATHATALPGTPGLTEPEVQKLAALSVQGTKSEEVYKLGWGGRIALGEYRRAPIGVASNPLRIFPYPLEIAACMRRFFEWRDARHYDTRVHPLIHACHMTAYFVHIHPFPDGNGRVSRMLMHDYMLRQGYLPAVMQNLVRSDYLAMISACQDGTPEAFVASVLQTQLEMLQTFHARQQMQ